MVLKMFHFSSVVMTRTRPCARMPPVLLHDELDDSEPSWASLDQTIIGSFFSSQAVILHSPLSSDFSLYPEPILLALFC